jgi:sirohydrochlorin ferrochelatase
MSAPDFREALAETIQRAWEAWDPTEPQGPITEEHAIADAVLALLAERLGGDEVREVVTQAISDSRIPDYVTAGRAARALAALRYHLGVTR